MVLKYAQSRTSRLRNYARSILMAVTLAAAGLLAACDNPLAEIVETLRLETHSPSLTIANASNAVRADDIIDLGTIAFSSTVDVVLTLSNTGNSILAISEDSITLLPSEGTGASVFNVVEKPNSIGTGSSAILKLRVDGSEAGNKSCALNIVTNDVITPSFKVTVKVTISELQVPGAPSGLRVDNASGIPGVFTSILIS